MPSGARLPRPPRTESRTACCWLCASAAQPPADRPLFALRASTWEHGRKQGSEEPRLLTGPAGMAAVGADVAAFVAEHDDFELFTASNGTKKVKCTTTNHEMLPQLDLCKAHRENKAYRKALRRNQLASHDWERYLPHIVPHKTDPYLLYCEYVALFA